MELDHGHTHLFIPSKCTHTLMDEETMTALFSNNIQNSMYIKELMADVSSSSENLMTHAPQLATMYVNFETGVSG